MSPVAERICLHQILNSCPCRNCLGGGTKYANGLEGYFKDLSKVGQKQLIRI
jgi:hypothetical protein